MSSQVSSLLVSICRENPGGIVVEPQDLIKNAKRIWDIIDTIFKVIDAAEKDAEEVRLANALLVLLRRMEAKESATYDIKEFGRVLPRSIITWKARYKDIRDNSSFIIGFMPEPAIV